ncbi:MAG: hypothetical protein JWQ96_2818 [Segetibacter sp.]|nr:hypothetical protein [Segetibacter sp.]
MYNIPYYKAGSEQEVLSFMQANPFVILSGCDTENRPVASHVPLLIKEREGRIYLQGHIMRQTDHHKAFVQNPNVLAIFTGPQTYVSASWYTDQKQASTWNYMTVHAKGKLQFGDEQLLLDVLKETTDHFENNPVSPSLVEELPPGYVGRLTKAIVAFEIEVTTLDHVFKLSQNRDEESYRNIIKNLGKQDLQAQQVAKEMEARSEQLFK